MSCEAITVSKSADETLTWDWPPSFYLTDYNAAFVVADREGSAPRLTVSATPTTNGSRATVTAQSISVSLRKADLQILPDGDPMTDPYVGIAECRLIAPDGIVTLVERTPFIAHKGI